MEAPAPVPQPTIRATDEVCYRRYQVNVVGDNGRLQGAPIIYDDNPTHLSLVGRVEHLARFGALVTDFNPAPRGTVIRGGLLLASVPAPASYIREHEGYLATGY